MSTVKFFGSLLRNVQLHKVDILIFICEPFKNEPNNNLFDKFELESFYVSTYNLRLVVTYRKAYPIFVVDELELESYYVSTYNLRLVVTRRKAYPLSRFRCLPDFPRVYQ